MSTKTKHRAKHVNNNLITSESGNSLYHRNLHALKKRYPALVAQITRIKLRNYRIDYPNGSEIPNLYLKPLHQFYYDINNPLEDTIKKIDELKLKNSRIAIFLGMGLGYELLCYTQRFAVEQNTVHIAVIEKDPEMLRAAMETIDLCEVIEHPGIELFVGISPEKLYVEFREYLSTQARYLFMKAVNPVYHPSSLMLDKNYYLQSLASFREGAVQVLTCFGNCPDDSIIGLNNMLDNLEEVIKNPGINLLYDYFKGKPAVVVSTGPSLNKNKHLLKDLEDKALIIAPDASLKVLMEMGVRPHMVTSLERDPGIAPLLSGYTPEQLENVYLAACPVLMPECFQVYNGPRVIVCRNFDHFHWMGIDRGMLPIKNSAGNMAFNVAAAMGCDPIILIGQDLAFSRTGETHARGAHYGDKQEYFYSEDRHLEVMGNDGQPILTTNTWFIFLKDYETDIAEYGGKCINSTEGGAYINGTTVMPFADAIQKYIIKDFYPRRHLAEILSSFEVEDARQDKNKVLKVIEDTLSDLEQLLSYCQEGLKTCEKYQSELTSALSTPEIINSNLLSRLPEIEKEIYSWRQKCDEKHDTFQLFLMHIVQSFMITFQIAMEAIPGKHNDRNLANIEILSCQHEWYAVLYDLILVCLKSLADAQKRLKEKVVSQGD